MEGLGRMVLLRIATATTPLLARRVWILRAVAVGTCRVAVREIRVMVGIPLRGSPAVGVRGVEAGIPAVLGRLEETPAGRTAPWGVRGVVPHGYRSGCF